MLKIKELIACIMVSFFAVSCCLNTADRKLVNEASIDAKEAKLLSINASSLATEAAQDADKAIQKSEIIFKQFHKK